MELIRALVKTPLNIYHDKGTLPIDRNLRLDRNTN